MVAQSPAWSPEMSRATPTMAVSRSRPPMISSALLPLSPMAAAILVRFSMEYGSSVDSRRIASAISLYGSTLMLPASSVRPPTYFATSDIWSSKVWAAFVVLPMTPAAATATAPVITRPALPMFPITVEMDPACFVTLEMDLASDGSTLPMMRMVKSNAPLLGIPHSPRYPNQAGLSPASSAGHQGLKMSSG